MAKQRAPIEFNTLSGGIITEASPLTFPDGASTDEENFEFTVNNARVRRFGIEYEPDAVFTDTGFTYASGSPKVSSSFLWGSVSGNSGVSIVAVQADNKVFFYDATNASLSSGIIQSYTGPTPFKGNVYGFANVQGVLLIATGGSDIIQVEATVVDTTVTLSVTTTRLAIRDLFGVPASYNRGIETEYSNPDYIELTDQAYSTKRPIAGGVPPEYIYNLRNQTFAPKRLPKTGETAVDPIESFKSVSVRLPSMSDTVLGNLYNNLDAEVNKTVDRFHAADLRDNPPGGFQSPKGYFIIDALSRSTSRKERWAELAIDQGYSEVVELPIDITPGGATAIAEYSGRAWYGGFSEEGSQTEAGGLKLNGYVLYSQLSSEGNVLTNCHQAGDPTSLDATETVATDGGFLSLDGAYGVSKLVPIGNSLLVFCANGVWSVSGSDGNYFTPTSSRVQKITDRGSVSAEAIVVIDSSLLFWANDGIYLVSINSTGDYKIENLTESTIQTLFDDIPYAAKTRVTGAYDSYSSQIVWTIYNSVESTEDTMFLKLLTPTGAFTKYRVAYRDDRTILGPVATPPFTLSSADGLVVVGLDEVQAGLDDVVSQVAQVDTSITTIKYAVVQDIDGYGHLSFATFSEAEYYDWGVTDASAYIITGYVSGGDFQRNKTAPYITMHFNRTEEGFTEDLLGDLHPIHPSSCFVQAQWDWANSLNSGKWSRTFQAYRYPRMYYASGITDTYDTGFSTINTKNKIRGRGRVLSLKFTTEEAKDCSILGWSSMLEVSNNV